MKKENHQIKSPKRVKNHGRGENGAHSEVETSFALLCGVLERKFVKYDCGSFAAITSEMCTNTSLEEVQMEASTEFSYIGESLSKA